MKTLSQAICFNARGGMWVKRISKTLPPFPPSWKTIHHHSMMKALIRSARKKLSEAGFFPEVNSDLCPRLNGCITIVSQGRRQLGAGKRTE